MEQIEELEAADRLGMIIAHWAKRRGDSIAVCDPDGTEHSYAQVNTRANQLVRLLRCDGAVPGDSIALICKNRAEFVEVHAACLRSGMRLTPINWHLTAEEIDYIVSDCEAKYVIADASVAGVDAVGNDNERVRLKLAVGGAIEGYSSYSETLATLGGSDIEDPIPGNTMMYTSGTTGKPKGVWRPKKLPISRSSLISQGYDSDTSVQMCAGPAYHAAPLYFDIQSAMAMGITLVFMGKWDSETVLRTISERRVTHMHLVPIMFQRLLALPEALKNKYPVDHVKSIVHGAAPCSNEVKYAMIDWFGPILSEYYAGSEGSAGFTISSEEWLHKPGSVGKRPSRLGVKIVGEDGEELPNGQSGTVYMQLPPGGFTYFNDEAKTQKSRRADYFTMGDIGFFDEDDYLFLTGRSAETIISGGVNIYPQEIDNALANHTAVADSATVGVPHDEWGEEVKSVIQLESGYVASEQLADEIIEFLNGVLPSFKVPRSVEFVTELPRSDAGKIQRGRVREQYWIGRERQI